ncbi:MAG: sugar phosphate isomerase/epimerase family protein [Geminicoccaceae bacterium]
MMSAITRRAFLASTAAAIAARAVRLHASPLGLPIGSQIYPHRALLKDFPGYCKTMSELGVTRLELCSPIGYGADFASLSDPKEVRKILDDHGMKAESSHFSMKELRERQQESIAWAKAIGITQMMTASLGDGNGGNNPTMDQVKKAAGEYNAIAAVAAKAGIQQGLHNEGFEVSMVDGQRTYDLLFGLLDPALVKFQFQMSTIANGLVGADYFTKYPGRFISMHVQDIDMNAPVPPPPADGRGRGRSRPQVAVGQGTIDWVKTFKAAKVGGVKNYFVEQTMELTTASVAALKAMNV